MVDHLDAYLSACQLGITLASLAPKSLAIQKAVNVILWTSIPLIVFYKLMFPFIWLLNTISNWILLSIGIQVANEHESAHTEAEIRILMEEKDILTKQNSLLLTTFLNLLKEMPRMS